MPPAAIAAALGIGVVLAALVVTGLRYSRARVSQTPDQWIDRLESGPLLDRVQRRRLRRLLHHTAGTSRSTEVAVAAAQAPDPVPPAPPVAEPSLSAHYRFKEEIPMGPGVLAAQPDLVESEVDVGFDVGASGELGASVLEDKPQRSFFGLAGSHQAAPARPNFGQF